MPLCFEAGIGHTEGTGPGISVSIPPMMLRYVVSARSLIFAWKQQRGGLLEQGVALLLQFLASGDAHAPGCLKGQSLDQDRLSCFQGDKRMRHAFATAEQESWPVLGIGLRIQRFRSTWRTVRSSDCSSFGSLSVMPFWP